MANLGNLAAALASLQNNTVGYAYSGYAPGTKLVNKLELEERERQNAAENLQSQKELEENTRQFNEELKEKVRSNNLDYNARLAAAAVSGVSGGGSNGYSTETERSNASKAQLLEKMSKIYVSQKVDNQSNTPLKDTMNWFTSNAYKDFPNLSEEERQSVAYDYIAKLTSQAKSTSGSQAAIAAIVAKYAPLGKSIREKKTNSDGIDLSNPNSIGTGE